MTWAQAWSRVADELLTKWSIRFDAGFFQVVPTLPMNASHKPDRRAAVEFISPIGQGGRHENRGLPAKVSDFEDCVPHRPPMVWVDDILSASDSGGECLIRVRRDALYCVNGRIEPMNCIEWIAQTFAFCSRHLVDRTGFSGHP